MYIIVTIYLLLGLSVLRLALDAGDWEVLPQAQHIVMSSWILSHILHRSKLLFKFKIDYIMLNVIYIDEVFQL